MFIRAYQLFLSGYRKEKQLHGLLPLQSLSRLWMGPLISASLTGFLYHGFFRLEPEATLGTLTPQTYALQLALGFLLHSILNSGYYYLPHKMMQEWQLGTLSLLWMSNHSKLMVLLSSLSIEYFRVLIISFLIFLFLQFSSPTSLEGLLSYLFLVNVMYALGVILGLMRCTYLMTHMGHSELLDYGYMFLILLSSFYVPIEFFPAWLHEVIYLFPTYQLKTSMIFSWMKQSYFQNALVGLFGVLSLMGVFLIIWHKNEPRIKERAFA